MNWTKRNPNKKVTFGEFINLVSDDIRRQFNNKDKDPMPIESMVKSSIYKYRRKTCLHSDWKSYIVVRNTNDTMKIEFIGCINMEDLIHELDIQD